jgi:Zn-dependent protease
VPEPAGLAPAATPRCAGCGTELPPAIAACPACHRLVHTDALRDLAAEAERAEAGADPTTAVRLWRRALELLPPESQQARRVAARVVELTRGAGAATAAPAEGSPAPGTRTARWLAPLGVVGLLVWKLKFVLVFVLSKAKLLALGLTKSSTLFSMLLSFAVYWSAWGWRFAAGLIVSMYVHEMGHVAALRRLGIRATAPMFVPGLGAFVRMEQYPADASEDARVGLAGPIWGTGAALAAFAAWKVLGAPFWGAIAQAAAWLNLFNLLPVWQLDGGRAMRPLSRPERWLVVGVLAAAFAITREGLLVLLLLAAGARAAAGQPGPGDRRALVEYVLLVLLLAGLSTVRIADVPV